MMTEYCVMCGGPVKFTKGHVHLYEDDFSVKTTLVAGFCSSECFNADRVIEYDRKCSADVNYCFGLWKPWMGKKEIFP